MSHCPYYAKKGLLLECPANLGCPKLWKYNPAPINRWEKFQLVIGFGILFGYPIYFSIIGEQYIWAGLAALGTDCNCCDIRKKYLIQNMLIFRVF